ncbi:MAG: helix-turn-helix domain-containing protein [Clostridia bacterium]|nr:helix-turn-helix domain-containing protein [Clostridia bacterium]
MEELTIKSHPGSESYFETHLCRERETVEHSHKDFYEIFITLTGGITHIFNGKKQTLDDKAVYIVNPGKDRHKFLYDGKMVGDGYYHFNLAFIKDYFERSVTAFSLGALRVINANALTKINLKEDEFNYLYSLMLELESSTLLSSRQTLVKIILTNVCMLLELRFKSNGENTTQNYAVLLKERIDNLEFMSKGIVDAYSEYPVAFSGLVKAFKKLTGKTVVEYLIERKIDYAKLLLLTTDYSVLAVAEKVGYESQSHFINVFKKVVGQTPLNYKKQNKQTVYGK